MNPSTALATVLVDELVRGGMTEAVLAPGSRSAPLALALHAEPRIRLHVRLDERSAGFLAVGLAKVAHRPVAVVCTSGTAAANLHPAVLEAAHAHVPLVVLTADRPPELRGTGANQTVDQIGLYGRAARFFAEVGVAEERPGMVAYWRSLVARAVATAPAHLNLAFREPLVPDGNPEWVEPLEGRAGGEPWVRLARPEPAAPTLDDLPERGVVLLGEGATDADAAVALAERLGWPVLSEPTGNGRHGANAIAAYPLLLANAGFAQGHRADCVLTVGKPGLSRSLVGWLRSAHHHVVVDPHQDWADPTRTAALVWPALPTLPAGRPATRWLARWLAADRAARAAIDRVLDGTGAATEPSLARDLVAALPDGALLFAGSSRPIRDLELAARPRSGVRVLGNRGVSGIDGSVSAAVGAALAHGGPAAALLGDLAFLHDQNGLVAGPDEPRPDLTFVVVDNNGGGIFSTLEPAAFPAAFERVFGTPHGVDLEAVAAATRIPYVPLERAADLPDALDKAGLGTPGLGLVHVRTDRAAGAALLTRLQAAVDATLSGATPQDHL